MSVAGDASVRNVLTLNPAPAFRGAGVSASGRL